MRGLAALAVVVVVVRGAAASAAPAARFQRLRTLTDRQVDRLVTPYATPTAFWSNLTQ
jgi:hypothetical protein